MIWETSWKADPRARVLADRHYNRHRVGALQFAPPGRTLVLWAPGAFWISSWQIPEYVGHTWAGTWVCSAFRNERPDLYLSSDAIREAVAVTRWRWPEVPELGMITFINAGRVRPKRDPGYCYLRAGFEPVGFTSDRGHVALQLLPAAMPEAELPLGVLV